MLILLRLADVVREEISITHGREVGGATLVT